MLKLLINAVSPSLNFLLSASLVYSENASVMVLFTAESGFKLRYCEGETRQVWCREKPDRLEPVSSAGQH